LVVTDGNLARTDHFQEFSHKLLGNSQVAMHVEFAVLDAQEPRSEMLNQQLESMHNLRIGTYIGYGGGSVMDSAKIFRAVKDSGHSLEELLEDSSKVLRKSQLILIPTTAGTGSEMSPVAVFSHRNEKVGLFSYKVRADVAAIDPRLPATCPRETLESSGIDAFIHALESTISKNTNFFSAILSPKSLQLVYNSLRKILEVPTPSRKDLLNLCKGIMLSSVSYGYAGCCGIHALAYPLGGKYPVRHGQANAILLLPVLDYYLGRESRLATAVRPFLTNGDSSSLVEDDREYVVGRVNDLLALCVSLPRNLSDIGAKISHLPFLASQCQKATILLGNSPVPISESEALEIYNRAMGQ
jgi:alcohol dehydrogenase class IV